MFGPIFEAASGKHTDIVFGKLDTDNNQDVAGALGITSIPTLLGFNNGKLVFAQAGALNAAQLEQVIAHVVSVGDKAS
jgi:thioredoxin 1